MRLNRIKELDCRESLGKRTDHVISATRNAQGVRRGSPTKRPALRNMDPTTERKLSKTFANPSDFKIEAPPFRFISLQKEVEFTRHLVGGNMKEIFLGRNRAISDTGKTVTVIEPPDDDLETDSPLCAEVPESISSKVFDKTLCFRLGSLSKSETEEDHADSTKTSVELVEPSVLAEIKSINAPTENYPDTYRLLSDTLRWHRLITEVTHRIFSGLQWLIMEECGSDAEELCLYSREEISEISGLLSNTPTMIVAGPVNSGKSSFINLMLNRRVVPTEDMQSTFHSVKLSRSIDGSTSVRVKEWDGWDTKDADDVTNPESLSTTISRRMMDLDDKTSSTECSARMYLDVQLPNDFLENLNVVECPGISSHRAYREVFEFVKGHPKTLFVYVFDATEQLTDESRHFLCDLQVVFPQLPIFCLVNKISCDEESFQRDTRDSSERTSASPHLLEKTRIEVDKRAHDMEFELKTIDLLEYEGNGSPSNMGTLTARDVQWDLKIGYMESREIERMRKTMQTLALWMKSSLGIQTQLKLSLIHMHVKTILDSVLNDSQSRISSHSNYLQRRFQKLTEKISQRRQENSNFVVQALNELKRDVEKNAACLLVDFQDSEEDNTLKIKEYISTSIKTYLEGSYSVLHYIETHRAEILDSLEQKFSTFERRISNFGLSSFASVLRKFINEKKEELPAPSLTISFKPKTGISASGLIRRFANTIRRREVNFHSRRVKLNIAEDVFASIDAENIIVHNYNALTNMIEECSKYIQRFVDLQVQVIGLGITRKTSDLLFRRLLFFDVVMEGLHTASQLGPPRIATSSVSNDSCTLYPHRLKINYGDFLWTDTMLRKVSIRRFSQLEKSALHLSINSLVSSHALGEGILLPRGVTMDTDQSLVFLMPKMETDVFSELVSLDEPRWTRQQSMGIAQQVVLAVEYIRGNAPLIHVDLRPENVLITYEGGKINAKLSVLDPPDHKRPYPNGVGPFHHTPRKVPSPEIESEKDGSQLRVDVMYQISYFLWWMLTSKLQRITPELETVSLSNDAEFEEIMTLVSRGPVDLKYCRMVMTCIKNRHSMNLQHIIKEFSRKG